MPGLKNINCTHSNTIIVENYNTCTCYVNFCILNNYHMCVSNWILYSSKTKIRRYKFKRCRKTPPNRYTKSMDIMLLLYVLYFRGRLNCNDINSLGLLPDKLKTELALHVNLGTLKKVQISGYDAYMV
mgnify:CR=1 FL=1